MRQIRVQLWIFVICSKFCCKTNAISEVFGGKPVIEIPVQINGINGASEAKFSVHHGEDVLAVAQNFVQFHRLPSFAEKELVHSTFKRMTLFGENPYRRLLIIIFNKAHEHEHHFTKFFRENDNEENEQEEGVLNQADEIIVHCVGFSCSRYDSDMDRKQTEKKKIVKFYEWNEQNTLLSEIINFSISIQKTTQLIIMLSITSSALPQFSDQSICSNNKTNKMERNIGETSFHDPYTCNVYINYLRNKHAWTGEVLNYKDSGGMLNVKEKLRNFPFVMSFGTIPTLDSIHHGANDGLFVVFDSSTWYNGLNACSHIQHTGLWWPHLHSLGFLFHDFVLSSQLKPLPPSSALLSSSRARVGESSSNHSDHSAHLEKHHCEKLNVMVVVATSGADDTTTKGCFNEIANTLAGGLGELDKVFLHGVLFCTPLVPQSCFPSNYSETNTTDKNNNNNYYNSFDKFDLVIILAPHNLINVIGNDNIPLILSHSSILSKNINNIILYNFEHVPSHTNDVFLSEEVDQHQKLQNRKGTFITPEVISVYQAFQLWDYSKDNINALKSFGIEATHVPLGYSPSNTFTTSSSSSSVSSSSSIFKIDILFYGTLTPHRTLLLKQLRSSHLRIFHANAANFGVFGEELYLLIRNANIVLSLRTFDDGNEWKISRFAPLLQQGAFVIAESSISSSSSSSSSPTTSYVEEEELYYRDGIVFVAKEGISRALFYYLNHQEERMDIAEKGHRLFMARTEASILSKPIEGFISTKKY